MTLYRFVYVCLSIHHRISRQKMAVPAVLSPQVVRDEKHKVDEALQYIKAKLAEARTLERRKVCCSLIIHTSTVQFPYLRYKFMPIATSIV